MKKTLLLSLIMAFAPFASKASAALLCHSVFQSLSTKTSHDIESSIREIAEMKLQCDLLKLQGTQQDPAQKAFSLQYPKKYQELVTELRDQLSEKEILELIKHEVRRQQGFVREKETKEVESREEQRKILTEGGPETKSYKYFLKTKGWESLSEIQKSTSAVYFPQSGKVFYVAPGGLRVGKPGNTAKHLFPADSFVVLSDQQTLLIRQGLQFLTFDLATETVGTTRDINFAKSDASKEFENIVLDPKEKHALLTGEFPDKAGRAVSVIDLRTNTEVLSHDQLPTNINAADFLDSEHLAVLHDKNKLSIINITSGKTVQNTTLSISPTSFLPDLAVAKNGKIISVFDKFKIISVDARNISLEIKSSTIEAGDTSSRTAMRAAGYKHALIEVDFNSGAKIFNMETLQVEFNFKDKYHRDADELFKMIPSADGESILAIYASSRSGNPHQIDVWQREQAQP